MGSIRLEANKPMQLPVDESFHFGASTRTWTLREKPANAATNVLDSSLNTSTTEANENNDSLSVSLLGLPEAENELHVNDFYWFILFCFNFYRRCLKNHGLTKIVLSYSRNQILTKTYFSSYSLNRK